MNATTKLAAAILSLPLLTGCIDDKYDLSDIDTTVKVNVNQLVIPVNIDDIQMETILDLNPDDQIKLIDGIYAIVQDGTFTSEEMHIEPIHLKAPAIAPSETVINLIDQEIPTGRASSASFSYDITSNPSDFRFSAEFVSNLIVDIDQLGCLITLDIDIELDGIKNLVNRISFSDVVLQLPRGFEMTNTSGGTYNPSTGELRLPTLTSDNGSLKLKLEAKGIDFNNPDCKYDYNISSVTIAGSLYIKQGKAIVSTADLKPGTITLPGSLTLRNRYNLSDTDVTSFSGKVKYNIEGTSLTEVSLNDLPDLLTDPATNLSFANPQIYLQLVNPLQNYNLYAQTGLKIKAIRDNSEREFTIDNPYFQIGPGNADGIYNFCLSPQMPANIDTEFSGAEHVPFSSLSNILSGNGVPSRLEFEITDPNIPTQQVDNFMLGQNLGCMNGKYKFFAPLEFMPGSTIIYTKTFDGWSSEELDNLTVTKLDVNLYVSTDIPVAATFTGYPIDADGNKINNVDIVGAQIDAFADRQKLTISITGEITRLDGIAIEVHAVASDNTATLNPAMHVTLSEIRPKVSGYYIDEL